MAKFCNFDVFTRFVFFLTCTIHLSAIETRSYLPKLSEIPVGSKIEMRLLDDSVLENGILLEISEYYVKINQDELKIEIPRDEVFRAAAIGKIFSDFQLTASENDSISTASAFKKYYLDYVEIADNIKIYGEIVSIDSTTIKQKAKSKENVYSLERVLKYRKNRKVVKLSPEALPEGWLFETIPTKRDTFHVLESSLGLASPLNFYPQLSAGLQTNSSWPLYLGARAGASGPIITAGWYYGQFQFFLGIKSFDIDFIQTSIIAGYIYRSHFRNTPVSCSCDKNSAGYFNDFTTIGFDQKNFYLAYAFRYRNIILELGWEFIDYYSESVSLPKIENPPANASNQQKLDETEEQARDFAKGIQNFSRLYLSIGYKFDLF